MDKKHDADPKVVWKPLRDVGTFNASYGRVGEVSIVKAQCGLCDRIQI